METHFILEQVQKMRPSSFSEEERHRYNAEKMMLRQFLLMKQQDQLPDYLSVRDMTTWLLTGRSFLEEFQEIIERTGIDHLFTAELAWTTARHLCLSQMEEELLEELDKEKCLSQLFSRKVTLEGLQMFVSVVHPEAEKVAQTYLSVLHGKLLQIFGGIQIASGPLSTGVAKPAELLELEQSAAALVPEVVDTALKFLLEEPELENKSEAASVEIGKLLTNSAFPCLSRFGRVSKTLLLSVCTKEAQAMVEAIYNRFGKRSKSFKLMDYDESYYNATEGVISAIQDMDHDRQMDASSQAHLQLEEGLLEKRETSLDVSPLEELEEGLVDEREASPRIALDEEVVDTFPNDVTEDTYRKEETLVQDSAVQETDLEVQFGESSQARIKLEEGLIEEREASLAFTSSEDLVKGLVEQREASPRVALDEEVDTLPNNVIENMDHEEQLYVYSQAYLQLEEGLIEEREASSRVSLDEEVEDTYRKEETLVQDSAVQDMVHKVQFGASSQAHLQLEEGLLEKREASLKVFSSEELEEGLAEEREPSPRVSLEEMAPMVSPADGDTSSVTLETNVAVHLDDELEVLQQEEVEVYETQDFLVQDCDDKKKKKGVRAFFCGFQKMMTCCFRVDTEQ